jgi:hypothetical protein
MNYDDPRLQELKWFLMVKKKLSIFTVKSILQEVRELFIENDTEKR